MRGVSGGQEDLLVEKKRGEGIENACVQVKVWFDLGHLCSHSSLPLFAPIIPILLLPVKTLWKKKKSTATFKSTSCDDAALNQKNSVSLYTDNTLLIGIYSILIGCIRQLLYCLSLQLDCKIFRTRTILPPFFFPLYYLARNKGLYQVRIAPEES